MIRSLIILLIPIAILVALFQARGGKDVSVIDPAPAIAEAVAAAAFPVGRPQGLPEQWRPVSAAFDRQAGGATLRIGYLAADDAGVQLIESSEALGPLTDRELGERRLPAGSVTIGQRTWQILEVRDGERALVWTGPNVTWIVVGQASVDQLSVLANALR
ncbi:MAG TPA: DUF4245 domain-containing protein [Micromonosporaceae bacterium]